MSLQDNLAGTWADVKGLVESVDLDLEKQLAGTAAAGARARKGLKELNLKLKALKKFTLDLEKERKLLKAERKARPSSEPSAV
jgi:hypothetical protein